MDTAKVTNAMGSVSASILGSSSRAGKRGWGNLEREGSGVRMGWVLRGNRAERADRMGQDRGGGVLRERRGKEEASSLSLTLQAIVPPPGHCILCPGTRQSTAQWPEAPEGNSKLGPRKRGGGACGRV